MLACCDMVKGGVEWFLLQLVCCSLCGSHTVCDNFIDEVESNQPMIRSIKYIFSWVVDTILQHCRSHVSSTSLFFVSTLRYALKFYLHNRIMD